MICNNEDCINVDDVLARLNFAGFTVQTSTIDGTTYYTVSKDGVYRAWQVPALFLLKIMI